MSVQSFPAPERVAIAARPPGTASAPRSVDSHAGVPWRPAVLLPPIAVLVALAFTVLAPDRAVAGSMLAAVLVVLSAFDIERGLIPNRIVLPAAGLLLLVQLALFPASASAWMLAPLAAALLLALPQFFKRAWMGMGDVKLALFIGVGLGWQVFGALTVAFLCVFPVALVALLRGGLAARKSTIPFGPFMAVGALFVLFGAHLSTFVGA
jgi:leader peptidase (prepilin peptidase)/N-methyltransferase